MGIVLQHQSKLIFFYAVLSLTQDDLAVSDDSEEEENVEREEDDFLAF